MRLFSQLSIIMTLALLIGCGNPTLGTGGATEDGNAIAGLILLPGGSASVGALVTIVPPAFDPLKDKIPASDSVRTSADGSFKLIPSFAGSGRIWVESLDGKVSSREKITAGMNLGSIQVEPAAAVKLSFDTTAIGTTIVIAVSGTPWFRTVTVTDTVINLDGIAPVMKESLFYEDSSHKRTVVTDSLTVGVKSAVQISHGVHWEQYSLPETAVATQMLVKNDTIWFAKADGLVRFSAKNGNCELLDKPISTTLTSITGWKSGICGGTASGIVLIDQNGSSQTILTDSLGTSLGAIKTVAVANDTTIMILAESGKLFRLFIGSQTIGEVASDGLITALAVGESNPFCYGEKGLTTVYYRGSGPLKTDPRSGVPAGTNLLAIASDTIWAGTNPGLYRLEPSQAVDLSKGKSPILDDQLADIKISSNGTVWFIASGGTGGVYRDGNWKLFSTESSPLSPTSRPVSLDVTNGWGWISTSDGKLFRVTVTGFN